MKKYNAQIVVIVLIVMIAIGMAVRITLVKRSFDRTVKAALETSEGYDQRFIDMVNRLEYELALRASFGYSGQKDPMTGKERIVVRQRKSPRRYRRKIVPKDSTNEMDAVKLTAIIFDDDKNLYTAIVMVGERSFAIEVGDTVVGRMVSVINQQRVVIEDDMEEYTYEITGQKKRRKKM